MVEMVSCRGTETGFSAVLLDLDAQAGADLLQNSPLRGNTRPFILPPPNPRSCRIYRLLRLLNTEPGPSLLGRTLYIDIYIAEGAFLGRATPRCARHALRPDPRMCLPRFLGPP